MTVIGFSEFFLVAEPPVAFSTRKRVMETGDANAASEEISPHGAAAHIKYVLVPSEKVSALFFGAFNH